MAISGTTSITNLSSRAIQLLLAAALSVQAPALAQDIAPEVGSRVFTCGNSVAAAVTLNGDELVRFAADEDDEDDAAEEAEDLAVRLQELIASRRLDPEKLFPATHDGKSAIKHDGVTMLEFDVFAAQDDVPDKKRTETALEACIKVVNGLRVALGGQLLPAGIPDMGNDAAIAEAKSKFSGHASWYGGKFNGRRCSDGSRFSEHRMTAAHRTLPFGTVLLVRNRRTGDSCTVQITDRGPFIDGRVIDLSKAAASKLNMLSSGVAMVDCLVLNQ